MEMEYHDSSRRGRALIILGIVLALAAGGISFYLLNQAGQPSSSVTVARVTAVVAVKVIPARKTIEASDIQVREVPADQTTSTGIVASVDKVLGRIPAVTILQGQLVTTNLLTSAVSTGAFSILGPSETVSPDSVAWRAISLTVAADRAVGGLLEVGQTVDIFMTAQITLSSPMPSGFVSDRSTKITYQNVVILARTGDQYVIRCTVAVAEEINHLLATTAAIFSMALRPDIDVRPVDASQLGTTTNRIISKYGLPLPEQYPAGGRPAASLPPLPAPTPFVTLPPATGPSAAPSPKP